MLIRVFIGLRSLLACGLRNISGRLCSPPVLGNGCEICDLFVVQKQIAVE